MQGTQNGKAVVVEIIEDRLPANPDASMLNSLDWICDAKPLTIVSKTDKPMSALACTAVIFSKPGAV